MTASEIIQAMPRRIVERFDPVRVVAFGSYPRGNASRDSDVDLLVVLWEVDNKREAAVAIQRAPRGMGLAKDVVVTTPDKIAQRGHLVGTVLRPALREGRVLYEGS